MATVFVRQLAAEVTDEDLTSFFSEIGPVKRAFVVRKRGFSKGYGFVTFAMEEDAVSSVEMLSGKELKGRALAVELSKEKGVAKDEGLGKEIKKRKKEEKMGPFGGQGLHTTVVVWNVPETVEKSELMKKLSAYGEVTHIDCSRTSPACHGNPRVAYVLFKDAAGLKKAVAALDGKPYSEGGAKLCIRRFGAITHKRKAMQKNRLFVSNLSFNATREDLIKAFSPLGPLSSVHLPLTKKKSDGTSKIRPVARRKRPRAEMEGEGAEEQPSHPGYAFVQYCCYCDAAHAVKKLLKKKIKGRVCKLRWASPKDGKDAETAVKEGAEAVAVEEEPSKEVKAEKEVEDSEAMDVVEKESATKKEQPEESEEEEVDSEESEEEEVGSEESESEEEGKEEASEPPPQESTEIERPDKDLGVLQHRTLFVRGLAPNTTDKHLFNAFRRYGALKYAVTVKDRSSGQCMGSGFVCFFKLPGAEKAMAAAGDGERAGASRGIQICGCRVSVVEAVQKDDVSKVKEINAERKTDRRKYDKRHLYLQHEGSIRADSELGATLHPADVEKRERALRDKKSKLANPLFYVSPTRLAVRNLALHVTEADLRKAALTAAKEGMAKGVVRSDEGDPLLMPSGARTPSIHLVKCKLIRESPAGDKAGRVRTDGAGKYRSRGFGFVEFEEHVHALAALRRLNNNPAHSRLAPGGGKKDKDGRLRCLIVEFAVENLTAVRQHEKRKEMQRLKSQSKKEKVEGGEEEAVAAPPAVKVSEKKKKHRRKRNSEKPAASEEAVPEPPKKKKRKNAKD